MSGGLSSGAGLGDPTAEARFLAAVERMAVAPADLEAYAALCKRALAATLNLQGSRLMAGLSPICLTVITEDGWVADLDLDNGKSGVPLIGDPLLGGQAEEVCATLGVSWGGPQLEMWLKDIRAFSAKLPTAYPFADFGVETVVLSERRGIASLFEPGHIAEAILDGVDPGHLSMSLEPFNSDIQLGADEAAWLVSRVPAEVVEAVLDCKGLGRRITPDAKAQLEAAVVRADLQSSPRLARRSRARP